MNKAFPPNAVRPTVSMPIIIGYFFNIAYGLYLYQFLRIDFSCQHVIPKLLKYTGVFPNNEFCAANSLLWTALVIFLLNDIAIVLVIAVYNRGIRLPFNQIVFAPGLVRALLIGFLALLVCISAYFYSDLRIGHNRPVQAMNVISTDYIWHQIIYLHLALGLINFVLMSCFVPRFYRSID
jgi:hypothetical protein